MLPLAFLSVLLFQQPGGDALLAARIPQLLHVVVTTDDAKQKEPAYAEAREIFAKRGLPSIAAVGDEASYEFVLLTCMPGPPAFQKRVLRKAETAAKRHEIPADAASYCAARFRQETIEARAKKRAPSDPALLGQIEQLLQVDQAVRQKQGFDIQKMAQTDREHAVVMGEIFAKYGVPTFRMVGTQAAANFVTMVQHQSLEFRTKVLPGLKANVDTGQADPGSYATVFDRLQTDAGKKEMYGQNLICDMERHELREGPIEDERHVNERRAAIGLIRVEIYAQLVVTMSPNICAVPPAAVNR